MSGPLAGASGSRRTAFFFPSLDYSMNGSQQQTHGVLTKQNVSYRVLYRFSVATWRVRSGCAHGRSGGADLFAELIWCNIWGAGPATAGRTNGSIYFEWERE
ncbi:hypothetical protein EVAR_38219_1 [Eumeta japonica]|uniref:Uncharacterized protein n=1 Tax=Eumeta variegata TaxID=151549 RepID=A0A4C1XIX2_EUMVA|nr:hypothetical protein EVAR_38219_1 [Eumeta japonica]